MEYDVYIMHQAYYTINDNCYILITTSMLNKDCDKYLGTILDSHPYTFKKILVLLDNKMGEIEEMDSLQEKFDSHVIKNIETATWSDIFNESFQNKIDILNQQYNLDSKFELSIKEILPYFIMEPREEIKYWRTGKDKYKTVDEYVIQDLAMILFGVEKDDVHYPTLIIPYYKESNYFNKLRDIAAQIWDHPYYEELRDKLEIYDGLTMILLDLSVISISLSS